MPWIMKTAMDFGGFRISYHFMTFLYDTAFVHYQDEAVTAVPPCRSLEMSRSLMTFWNWWQSCGNASSCTASFCLLFGRTLHWRFWLSSPCRPCLLGSASCQSSKQEELEGALLGHAEFFEHLLPTVDYDGLLWLEARMCNHFNVHNCAQQNATKINTFFLKERIRWPWNRRNARFLADLSELIAPKTENALQLCCMPKMYCTYYDCTIEACSWSILRGMHHLGTREDKLQLLHQAKASGDERKLRQALQQATSETSWQVPAALSFRFLQRKL